ncbi:MAG TPA: CHAT domain-containing protein [Syntrophales bacterium]|nr:CHAT domain-containing protein [Syntrophales bacterium]HOM07687.1 CHAT domain-containing protein [Syntrophales bacterium]HOO00447.1 CHAT domain-containing protein [Syntrophales bacterium]HPC00843.1 CHAT domain-containing protein [Syntrophales bacterium]HPQ07390.1 CHAT domain-containing protein [Syntrophales bacterium]
MASGVFFRGPSLTVVLSILVFLLGGCAHTKTEELFTKGQYDEAERVIETRIPDTAKAGSSELVWLCQARYKLKKYAPLFSCLDELERKIAGGDRYLRGDINSLLGTMRSFPHDLTVIPHLIRAEALIETADYDGAARQAQLAYDKALAINWPFADIQINWERICRIRALGLLAMAHAFRGDMERSRYYSDKLEEEGMGFSARYFVEKEKTLALGRAYMAQGRYDKVLELGGDFLLAFAHVFTLGIMKAVEGTNYAYVELPKEFVRYKALFETGRIGEAKEGYDRLLRRPETRDNGELYWPILYDRGRIHERQGERKKALERYRQAVEVVERQRSTINNEASKIGFVGDKQGLYHRVVDLSYAEGDFEGAFAYTERAKARALVDLLAASALADGRDPLGGNSLVAVMTEAEREEKAAAFTLAADASQGRRGIEIRQKIKERDPELASLVSVDPPAPAEIRAALDREETLLEYFLQGNDLFAFLVTKDGIRAVKLDGRGLDQLVRRYREELKDLKTERYAAASGELWGRLIDPLRPHLRTGRLLVVPHGILHYLPFASLKGPEGYLGERFTLSLLPSGGVLTYLKARKKVKNDEILILANPDLGDERLALRFAEREGEDVASLFGRSRKLVGKEASKGAFLREAGRYGYIHVAAHGVFLPERPLNSGLMLAGREGDDGLLRVKDIYGLRLDADLVVLSACETALGRVGAGDDVLGLTRGFLYAGAHSVIASLWPVDDEATAEFMKAFYTSLKKKDKAEALKEAQASVRARYTHPYFWAPFQLVGLGR